MGLNNVTKTKDKKSVGFTLSIFLAIIVVSLQVLLIVMIPLNVEETVIVDETESAPDGDNFFYRWSYREISDDDPLHKTYRLRYMRMFTGCFIVIPFIFLGIIFSGSTLFLSEYDQTKKMIIINSVFNLLPITVAIIYMILINSQNADYWGYVFYNSRNAAFVIGFIPFITNLFLYITLMVDKKSLLKWSGVRRKDYSNEIPKTYLNIRRVNFAFISLAYIGFNTYFFFVFNSSFLNDAGYYVLSMYLPIYASVFLLFEIIIGRVIKEVIMIKNPIFDSHEFSNTIIKSSSKFSKKRLIPKLLAQGTTDFPIMSSILHLSIEDIDATIRYSITDGKLKGTITEDSMSYIPHKEDFISIEKKEVYDKSIESIQPSTEQISPITQSTTLAQSPKSRLVTLLLCISVGSLGIHRFYVNRPASGVLYLLTFGLGSIGTFVDFIMILVGTFKDSNGNLVLNWDLKEQDQIPKAQQGVVQQQPTQMSSQTIPPSPHTAPPPPQPKNIDHSASFKDNLVKIIKRYDKISLEEMSALLGFDNKLELQKWLLSLPIEFNFRITDGIVFIPTDLQGNDAVSEGKIARLLSFTENSFR